MITKPAYFTLLMLVMLSTVLGDPKVVKAAEGGSSHYLPGAAGDVLIAQSPKPGLQAAMTIWYQTGEVNSAVLQGRVGVSLDLDLPLAIPGLIYTFGKPILGGTYTIGIAAPFGYGRLDAQLTGSDGILRNVNDDSFGLSDIAITPFQINWDINNFHFKFAEVIVAPTGAFDLDDTVNLGA
jgi:hypothetical protein